MQRVPEKEVMDDWDNVRAYAEEDFSESDALFLNTYLECYPFVGQPRKILDLGCGPAVLTVKMAARLHGCQFDAVDASQAMLKYAEQNIALADLRQRIRVQQVYLPGVMPANDYDVVISNSLLHHLHSAADLWQTIRQCTGVSAYVHVMDLFRPRDESHLQDIVQRYAVDAPEVLKTDFTNSLRAAYTVDEIKQTLAEQRLDHLSVREISDRHLLVTGFLIP